MSQRTLQSRVKVRPPKDADITWLLDQKFELLLAMICARLEHLSNEGGEWAEPFKLTVQDWMLIAVAVLKIGDMIEDARRAREKRDCR